MPLMRFRYYWAFPVSGKMTALALPSCNVRLPVTWSMTAQSSPAGHPMGAGLLVMLGGLLIVATWFAMRSCPWRRLARVLYQYCLGTIWVSDAFWCSAGNIGLVSSGIMCGTHWGGRLGARTCWNIMSPCGSNLGGGAGAASGVVSGVCNLGGGVTNGGRPWRIFLKAV